MNESTFTYNADSAFIRKVARSQMTPAVRKLNVLFGALAALVGASLVMKQPILTLAAAVGMFLVLPYLMKAQKPTREVVRAMRAQFGSLPQPREITVHVDTSGVRLTNANGSQDLSCLRAFAVNHSGARHQNG